MVRAVCILYDMRHATSVQDSINAVNLMRSEMAKGYVFLPEITGLADCPGRIQWDESNRILSFKIMAKPNSEIGFKVLGAFFRGSKGYLGNGEAVIHFFTGN